MSEQFARMTAEEIIREHQLGFLTATGVVRYYIKCSQAYNWRREYCPQELYKMLGISKSSFYKAIAALKTLGYIDFDIQGKVGITNTEPGEGILAKNVLSEISDSRPKKNTAVQNLGKSDRNLGQASEIVVSKSSKALPGANSSDSPDLIQINQLKSSIINQSASAENPDDDDDDDFENSFLEKKEQVKEKPIVGDRHKRMVKALKTILEECSSDPEEWDGFFDWCEAELWPSFNEPVKNKIGFLKSIEPDSGLTRLEFNWDNFLCDQSNKNAPASSEIDLLWERARKLANGCNSQSKTSDFISMVKEPRFYQAVFKCRIWEINEAKANRQRLKELKQLFVETYENWVEPVEIVLSPEEQARQDAHFEVMKERLLGKHSTNSLVGGIH